MTPFDNLGTPIYGTPVHGTPVSPCAPAGVLPLVLRGTSPRQRIRTSLGRSSWRGGYHEPICVYFISRTLLVIFVFSLPDSGPLDARTVFSAAGCVTPRAVFAVAGLGPPGGWSRDYDNFGVVLGENAKSATTKDTGTGVGALERARFGEFRGGLLLLVRCVVVEIIFV